MHVLSTAHSMFVTRVLPFAVIAGACGWAYWPKRNEGAEPLIFALIFFVIGSFIMYRKLRNGLWRNADIVEDHGNHLVITRWRTTIEIPLSQIQEVMRVPSIGGIEVTIILKAPCAFGSEITFYPPHKRKAPDIERALDSLSRRVSSEESKHVA